MFAEFIYQRLSGQYEEITFDIEIVWKPSTWCWVRFMTDDDIEWCGSFRGTAEKVAVANETQQVAVLTSSSIYIINTNNRKVLFHEEQTDYIDLIHVPSDDKFLVATYVTIEIIEQDFKIHPLEMSYDIDYVRFIAYEGKMLLIEIDKMPDYCREFAYINTDNWKVTNKE